MERLFLLLLLFLSLGVEILLGQDIGIVHIPGSSSLFAEAIHSCVDTINQAMLAVGIERSKREPDAVYNYGNMSKRIEGKLVTQRMS